MCGGGLWGWGVLGERNKKKDYIYIYIYIYNLETIST